MTSSIGRSATIWKIISLCEISVELCTCAEKKTLNGKLALKRAHLQNNLVIRGQYMYPRHAPLLLAGLIRAGLLRLEAFSTRAFPLEEVNQAIQYAHDHGGAFRLTVLTP